VLDAGRGLTQVSTSDLTSVLRALVRDEIRAPVTPLELAKVGLLRLQDELGYLRGLSSEATRAVLIAVIAERRRASR
jgi:hypothetical protein